MSVSVVLFRSLRQKCLRSSSSKFAVRFGSDHHGPNMPPFAQRRPPSTLLPEEVELVWDDGVAPETCIDFDASHVSTREIFSMFFGVFGAIFAIAGLVKLSDPAGNSPVAPRSAVIPANTVNLFCAVDIAGGAVDHDEEEEEEDDDE